MLLPDIKRTYHPPHATRFSQPHRLRGRHSNDRGVRSPSAEILADPRSLRRLSADVQPLHSGDGHVAGLWRYARQLADYHRQCDYDSTCERGAGTQGGTSMIFDKFLDFISSLDRMRVAAVYQPAVIRALISTGGSATEERWLPIIF